MSNHPIQQEQLMAYLDGELEAARAAEAAAHLKQCPECQKLAAELQEVSQMLMAWQVDETEAEPGSEVTSALEERQRQPQSQEERERISPLSFLSRRRLAWGVGLAALVLLVLGVSIPNLLRSGKAANESAELARLRGLVNLESNPAAPPKTPKTIAGEPKGTHRPIHESAGQPPEDQEEVDQEDQGTSEKPQVNAPMIIR